MEKEDIAVVVTKFIGHNFVFDQSKQPSHDQSLLDTGVIDSTGILELVEFVEKTFHISVEDNELVPANLGSIDAVANFVIRKTGDR